jgi:hypothetical protein
MTNTCTGLALTISWESITFTSSLISSTQVLGGLLFNNLRLFRKKKVEGIM